MTSAPRNNKHNHMTRDIKPLGKCPLCDEYHDKHIPKKNIPREWWLEKFNYYSHAIFTTLTAYTREEKDRFKILDDGDTIHVVEHSALVAAQEEIERLRKEHENFCEQAQEKTDDDFAVVRDYIEKTKDELTSLRARHEGLRLALQQISKTKYGLELTDTDEYLLEHWSKQALSYEQIARDALAKYGSS
jgi:hypothetical protein